MASTLKRVGSVGTGALAGAGAGAALGSVVPVLGTAIGAGLGGLVGGLGGLFGSDDSDERRQREEDIAREEAARREALGIQEKKRARSLNLLDQMKAPEQSDAARRRIAALEEESQMGPLSQDALFQGDRATLIQGGQQALSNIQNTQRAAGTSGGFANQGSIQDTYDRLSGGLAQLGQQSRQVKEAKRDTAAELQQSFLDSQTQFQNAQTNAKIAIEQGNADAAAQYLQQAYQARQDIEQNYRKQIQAAEQRQAAQQSAALGAAGTLLGKLNGRSAINPSMQSPSNQNTSQLSQPTYASLRGGGYAV